MLFLLALAMLFQEAPADAPKLATLDGTVVQTSTRIPIRKAKVTLTQTGWTDAAYSAESGDDGKYTIKDVKPGRYTLKAEKAGYEPTAYGARRAGSAFGEVIQVNTGASLTNLTVALPKHGAIAGKVLDADN